MNIWIPLTKERPSESETVWFYNKKTKFVMLGCIGYIEDGYLFATSNGIIYSENGKIVSECEYDDDYEFTHFARLPELF